MAGTTPKGFRFPQDADAPNIAVDIENLADDVDAELDDYITTATATSTFQSNVITTEGDLIVGDATGDPVRLPVGAAGEVLTSDGDTVSFVAPAGGGGFSVITSGTLSAATTNLTSIPQTFRNLRLIVQGPRAAADNSFLIRFNSDTNDYVGVKVRNRAGNIVTVASATASIFTETLDLDNTNSEADRNIFIVDFNEYTITTNYKQYQMYTSFTDASQRVTQFIQGRQETTTAITSVQIIIGTTPTAGSYVLLGQN